jgi:hypothetical protein
MKGCLYNMLIFKTIFVVETCKLVAREAFSTSICHVTLKEQCVYTLNTFVVGSMEK